MNSLEQEISSKTKKHIPILQNVATVLSRDWMGDIEKKDSPFYALKRNYKYDVDRNSGFYKTRRERIMDNLKDNSMPWIIGALLTIAGTLVINYLNVLWNLKQ